MGILSYSLNVSLDGYIEDAAGSIGFTDPDEEVHRFANEETRATAALLFGRGVYEVMEDFWTAPERADGAPVEAEFAKIYAETPRIVFSDSLESVAPGCRLVRRADSIAEMTRLKAGTDGELGVAGAGLAASVLDLIDEFKIRLAPCFVGGGKPYVPLGTNLRLQLLEQRAFRDGTMYLRYGRR
jgi:dihydrofolate reductase